MSFTDTVKFKLSWNTTYTTEPDGTITVQRDAPDGYLIIDRMLDFSELVDKVLSVIGVDREGLYIDFSLVWTERSGKRSRVHINDDNTVRFIYLCADKWPELYPEKVERTGHVYASTSGQDIGASTSGGRTVEDNEDGDEDGDEDEDKDEDKDEDADEDEDVGGVESSDDEYVPSDEDSDDDTDFESSSSVPYVFDDISGWDKTLEEVENDGIKMWDGNPLTLGLDIHFANKPEAQAAVGEWNLVHGRTFRVKTSMKATDTWKMVVWSDSHNCLGANKRNESRNVTSSMIARLVAQNVRKHPDFAVAQIQIEVMKRYQVECSYKKAWHGRRKALEALYGTWESNFQQLPSFLDALFMSNPDTCVQFKFKENSGSSQRGRKKSLRQKVNRFSKRNQKYEVVTIAPDNQPWKADEKQVVLFQTEESRLTSVSITEIKTHIENNPLTDLSPDDAHLQRARCFVGWLVGGLLFSNTMRNSFPLDLVHFLHTPEICSEYDWGSAALCYLYRKDVQSSLAASPRLLPFVWMPYTTLLGRIARVCLVGQGIWRSQTWLICGDVVAPHNPSRVFRQFGYHQRIPGDALLLTAAEITSLLKRKPFGGSDRRWLQQLGIYLQVWNDRHGQVVGTDDLYVGEPSADPEYLLWYHQVTVKYVTDPTDSENARGFHGSAETLRLMATLMEDVRSPSIIGQRTFDADSFGYDR
ncbi:OLC1v1030947C1 [Oldenlandia corymbosa var. corymbosa]|uniref:OLC1v1030947C1 n=1 Tax=Oldenlandia corymbosa var. corymbosa TaxID=529605 RepID=A0AAV1CJ31_OLDCO|nr:OLC1v1030947C1 [Oldenlandia corymbosa var. corymbosa]